MSADLGTEAKQPPRLPCPNNWVLTSLATVADVALGKTPSKNDYVSKGSYKIVKYRDLGDDRHVDWTNAEKGFVDPSRVDKLNLRKLAQGDVLISASAHSSEIIGRKVLHLHRLPDEFESVFYVGEILCIRAAHNHAPDLARLLSYFFLSINGYKSIQAKVHGVHLIASRAAEMKVPLAPVAEQQRIVSKIDELFSRIDEGKRSLERAQKLVERYRLSVLKAAVTGELTREWREKNKSKLESGEALLARILKARREAWEKAELEKMKDNRVTPVNDKWKQKYEEPRPPDTTDLPELPAGWCWSTANALTDETRSITYGVIKLGEPVSGGVPTLRSSNIRHLRAEVDYVKPIAASIASQYQRTFLSGGEVLVTVRGTLGGVTVAPASWSGWNISREVALLSPVIGGRSQAIAYFIGSPILQRWLMKRTKGNTYTGVNIETLKDLPIPVPPELEAQRVCDLVSRALASADRALATALHEIEQANRYLRQSVLEAAFMGKLVGHDSADEPASALLERIAAERCTDNAARKRGGKKKTTA